MNHNQNFGNGTKVRTLVTANYMCAPHTHFGEGSLIMYEFTVCLGD